MKTIRCAIYTRKSSDEGLEQAFNSLDAQREACAAYVLSQASEGWVALPDIYDDGGLSGGTLQRPALQRLLAEVAARQVDIIVVYKVDRLTRSLFDFAKLVETLDAGGTSFVSVTQSFNTTTSMGRLTLNMLLSFAQFEREVTAERIRDKIAASKAKGMWMGGTPPLGYRPDGRSLAIVEDHANLVRHVFARYLALGNVRAVERELIEAGKFLPVRERLNGNASIGGGRFSRGQIYKMLSNQVYIGRIAHGTISYAGLHAAIVPLELWEPVQVMLADNRQGHRTKGRSRSPSLLAGKLIDEHGAPLLASHASKGERRYRYYASKGSAADTSGLRVPALEIETMVAQRLAQAFDDPFSLADATAIKITADCLASLAQNADDAALRLRKRERALTRMLVNEVRIHRGWIDIVCHTHAIAKALGILGAAEEATVTLTAQVTLTRTGRAVRLVQDDGAAIGTTANPSMVKLLIKARRWWTILREGEIDTKALAASEGVQASYVSRVIRLMFLSPAVVDALLKGSLQAGVDAKALTLGEPIPACWQAQATMLLPRSASISR